MIGTSENECAEQKRRRCHVCREKDVLTAVANGFARLCRFCIIDAALVARLEQAAREAGYEREKQSSLF